MLNLIHFQDKIVNLFFLKTQAIKILSFDVSMIYNKLQTQYTRKQKTR